MADKIIAFTRVALPFGWLGNMAPFPIVHDDIEWRTSEALFQALRFSDKSIRELIRNEKSPMSAKMIAKSHKDQMTVVPQSSTDLMNMRKVLSLKLEQHSELKKELVATGDANIIEDCTKRQHGSGLFWGAARVIDSDGKEWWNGSNNLGHLWQWLRTTEIENGK
jgi:ribA/ribD-fused uncharacterized protein